MALVNIGEGNRGDQHYRYKMPKMVTKIEGRGNGIKTNLVNMVDVAKALARHPAYTTKYFGCVLGAQSKFDEKTGTSTVNGAHENSKLTDLLEGFIKKYVQCYGCGNPETEIVITKSQMITLKCAACGFLSDVDMRDKLTTFILNNPPEQKKGKGSKQLRKAEKERLKAGEAVDEEAKAVKKGIKKKGEESAKKTKKPTKGDDDEKNGSPDASQRDEEEAGDDDVEWQTDTSAEAAKRRIEEQLTTASSEMVMLQVDDKQNGKKDDSTKNKSGNDDDLPSPSVNGSQNLKSPRGGQTAVKEEEEEEEEEDEEGEEEDQEEDGDEEDLHSKLVSELKDYVQTHTLAEVAAHVKGMGEPSLELLAALFEALFGGIGKGLSKEVAKKKGLLGKVLPDNKAQGCLLVAVERYCGVVKPDAIKEVPLVLKKLYDEDIVEEEQILLWYDRKQAVKELEVDGKVAAAVRKEATPFVQWLKEAEAESDEEE